MDLELLLNASDEDSFEVPESPGVRSFRQPRLRSSVSLIPASRPSSSVDDGIVEPSIPSGSRGRSRTRRPKEATYSRRSLQPRSRSRSPPKRSSHRAQRSPRLRRTDRSSAPNMSEWTVARLKHFLSQNNIPFHRTDNKARLFQLHTNSLKDSTLSRPSSHDLPGSRRRARDDVRDVTARRSATRTPSSSATSASPVQSASNPMQALSAPQPFPPPTFSSAALTSHAYTFHHPSIPSSSPAPIFAAPSLPAISAAPPPAPTTAAAQTAQTTAGPSSSTSYTQPVPPLSSFHPPCLLPYPPAPHDLHSSITRTTAPAPPYPTALHTASLGLFLAPTPPSSSYTLATAQPPVRPLASARPSPVSPTLRQQILTGTGGPRTDARSSRQHPHPESQPLFPLTSPTSTHLLLSSITLLSTPSFPSFPPALLSPHPSTLIPSTPTPSSRIPRPRPSPPYKVLGMYFYVVRASLK
ncbi:vegetative cell wall protein gp1-like [Thunnus maccoyii]|uniref:vegetative cell wall protein gp1-like n=1 Tax=Thunnus maccoyii TaxID=8240 RepID=UPI001C4C3EF7|nr:vegetative cell wall protein gp1-like [Thunnus maccoyii]